LRFINIVRQREFSHGQKKQTEKKARNAWLTKSSSKTLILLDEHNESIYRFFSEEYQANALAQGEVWLSTLETCRAYEDPAQGDLEEAHETYNSGHAVGGVMIQILSQGQEEVVSILVLAVAT
jgi:hypothetical protein